MIKINLFKRALSQKSLYPGLFRILWMVFFSEISWPEMKSTMANDNRRFKQTMLRYFKRVTIYPNRSVHDAFRIFYLCITISWKWCVFYWNGSVHVISFKSESWKTLTFKISLKRIFTCSSVIEYSPMCWWQNWKWQIYVKFLEHIDMVNPLLVFWQRAVYDLCKKTYSFLLDIDKFSPAHSDLLADK